MNEELEITARNEAEAIEKALEESGLDADQVDIEVEALGKNSKGILGFGAKAGKYLIKLHRKEAAASAEATGEAAAEEDAGAGPTSEVGPKAEELLTRILELMGMSAQVVSVKEDAEKVNIDLDSEDSGILIGRRGQTLDALQYLVSIIANREAVNRKRIVLDIEGYRVRRNAELEELAKRMAGQAVERGTSVELRPMSAYERRIIHVTLQDDEEVETVSEGEEPERKVLIVPKS